eukprot:CAMPEP_0202470376 /NCGR_PEP_ID=MMETSP1360-20130828/81431_1 /ASSEMBLY_ACC=CAM_ASM_000848 /TAXON_ID=515479 /ORGANISM="Licmophora paradoxa, Strain CCMP2313" /LENGTH=132 /DNA_ID=CAMNT_0049096063 /DNA_START=193 /DNA_END=591 /DNA_ORIENTATION=+
MECVDEIDGATEDDPLEEAIEYCNSEQLDAWRGTPGAMEWVRSNIIQALQQQQPPLGTTPHSEPPKSLTLSLSASDLEWEAKLMKLEKEGEEVRQYYYNDDDGDDAVDVVMFAGMFRTSMEMIEEAGLLKPE